MFTAGREWRGCGRVGKHFGKIEFCTEQSLGSAPDYIHSVNKDTENWKKNLLETLYTSVVHIWFFLTTTS